MARKAAAEQKRQDALIALGLSRRGTAATSSALIVPSYAVLAAFNVGAPASVQGRQAFVQSNGSLWSLMTSNAPPVDATAVDPLGQTVVNATGIAGARWVRQNVSGYLPADSLVTLWNIDPQNVTTRASVEAPGTALAPVSSVAEVMRRLGYTWSPDLKAGIIVQLNWLSASPDDYSDPCLLTPNLEIGARLIITAPLPAPGFTGTLLAVTPKDRASNTLLASTFTTATGTLAPLMLLVNTTRGDSRAFAHRDLGGGDWRITQPFLPSDPLTGTAGDPVDTWANGDSVEGFVLTRVDVPRHGGTAAAYNTIDFGEMSILFQIDNFNATDLTSQNSCEVVGTCFPLHVDCIFRKTMVAQGPGQYGKSTNVIYEDVIPFQVTSDQWLFNGGGAGQIGAAPQSDQWYAHNALFQFDFIFFQGTFHGYDCSFSNGVALEAGIAISGDNNGGGVTFTAATLYGSGAVNQRQGTFRYAGSAVGIFPTSGGLLLNGVATGYSRATALGVTTIHGGIPLTAANLDAPAGAAGFGGFAEGGGAFFCQSGAQP